MIGRLFVAQQFHRRVWHAVRDLSLSKLHRVCHFNRPLCQDGGSTPPPRSRLAGCSVPISYTVAFGQLIRGHDKRGANERGRSRSAPRARPVRSTQRLVTARRRETLPCCQPKKSFSVPKAQRRGRTHRSPRRVRLLCGPPRCATRPERGTLPESSSFSRLERGSTPARPPNPALQPTASRARSLLFERDHVQRARGS